ncbi:MAG: hypothetical protein R2753_12200 [Chitinophagales bacterium]
MDQDGNKIPVDFVSTGNNHHVAIYRDEKGEMVDYAVSFSDAVRRKNFGLPIVPKDTNKLWDKIHELGINNQSFLATLPKHGLQLEFSMKQNEYFVFHNEATDFNPKEIDLLDSHNKKLISPNLFIVQTISKVMYGNNAVRDYVFRHHLDTTKDKSSVLKGVTHHIVKSLLHLQGIIKVRVNHLGDIVSIGEY